MRRSSHVLLVIAFGLSGCGLYTPDVQEFWGSPGDAAYKKRAVIAQVTCEVQNALQILIKNDQRRQKGIGQPPRLDFLYKNWGIDILMVLTIDEKSTLAPSVSFNTPVQNATKFFSRTVTTSTPQSFSTTFGGQLSSEGYRQEKVHIFFKVADLTGKLEGIKSVETLGEHKCPYYPANATLFVQSDLKIYDWLNSMLGSQEIGQIDLNAKDPLTKDGVLSDEIRFEIVSMGNINPTWKLIDISANMGSAPLYNASRDRTQDLTITLGPAKDGSLSSSQGQISTLTSEFNATLRSISPVQ